MYECYVWDEHFQRFVVFEYRSFARLLVCSYDSRYYYGPLHVNILTRIWKLLFIAFSLFLLRYVVLDTTIVCMCRVYFEYCRCLRLTLAHIYSKSLSFAYLCENRSVNGRLHDKLLLMFVCLAIFISYKHRFIASSLSNLFSCSIACWSFPLFLLVVFPYSSDLFAFSHTNTLYSVALVIPQTENKGNMLLPIYYTYYTIHTHRKFSIFRKISRASRSTKSICC